jgi:fumarate hydratase subunit beta
LLAKIRTLVSKDLIKNLQVRDKFEISGAIYTGRDAALPLLVKMIKENRLCSLNLDLEGGVIFHTAVSTAGIGPTTSSKVEIEESISPLSRAGVRIHIGKGSISCETVKALQNFNSIFAITPPVSALFAKAVISKRIIAFPEEGIEAIYELVVEDFPAIVAVSQGKSIYDK